MSHMTSSRRQMCGEGGVEGDRIAAESGREMAQRENPRAMMSRERAWMSITVSFSSFLQAPKSSHWIGKRSVHETQSKTSPPIPAATT